MGHRLIRRVVVPQALGLPEDRVGIGTGESDGSGIDGFGPLGRVAGDKDGLAERGRFFLNTPRIGNDQMGAIHEPDERQVIERLDEMDILDILEDTPGRTLDIGVQVDRIDNLHIAAQRQRAHGGTDFFQTPALILATVAGDENQLLVAVQKPESLGHLCFGLRIAQGMVAHPKEGIDDGVTGNLDTIFIDAFPAQVRCRTAGRGEVQGRERSRDLAVHLLGPWRVDIARAQARLDMADRNLLVIGGHGGGHGGRRVAMDENPVGLHLLKGSFQPFENRTGDMGETLRGAHHVEIAVGNDPEQVRDLHQHLAMLACQADARANIVTGLQRLNDRCHLDRLGPSAKDADDVRDGGRGHGQAPMMDFTSWRDRSVTELANGLRATGIWAVSG